MTIPAVGAPAPGTWSPRAIPTTRNQGSRRKRQAVSRGFTVTAESGAALSEAPRVTVTRLGTSLNKRPEATDGAD